MGSNYSGAPDSPTSRGKVPAGGGPMVLAAAGDFILIGAFIYLGMVTHRAPLTFSHWLKTAGPFLGAWLVVGAVTGVFRRSSLKSLLNAFVKTAVTWVIAGGAALLIRSYLEGRGISWAFAGVVVGTNIGVLGAWRVALAALMGPKLAK